MAALLMLSGGCRVASEDLTRGGTPAPAWAASAAKPRYASPLQERLVAAALERVTHQVQYDGGYYALSYPGGDVPTDKGACTDEVIRSYRALDIDLQREVHEDMVADFAAYPRKFGLSATDANIDHRRVPNLMTFFTRKGAALAVTDRAEDYPPGDVVAWDLDGKGMTHIGIVVDAPSATPGRYLIMHNIGAGPQLQDVLFSWRIIGHYRYPKPAPTKPPAEARPSGRV